MDELKRARLETLIAWAGYFIAFVGITVLLVWAWIRH
jgi:polyferredoxin